VQNRLICASVGLHRRSHEPPQFDLGVSEMPGAVGLDAHSSGVTAHRVTRLSSVAERAV
jgi:hypothetical protein